MSRFKTELCNNLIELGSCKYGDRCHYAHGLHELRQVVKRHPKFRTEKCKNFELTGKCPFGPRCSYVHSKPDLDSMIEQLTRYMKHKRAPRPDSDCDDAVVAANDSVPDTNYDSDEHSLGGVSDRFEDQNFKLNQHQLDHDENININLNLAGHEYRGLGSSLNIGIGCDQLMQVNAHAHSAAAALSVATSVSVACAKVKNALDTCAETLGPVTATTALMTPISSVCSTPTTSTMMFDGNGAHLMEFESCAKSTGSSTNSTSCKSTSSSTSSITNSSSTSSISNSCGAPLSQSNLSSNNNAGNIINGNSSFAAAAFHSVSSTSNINVPPPPRSLSSQHSSFNNDENKENIDDTVSAGITSAFHHALQAAPCNSKFSQHDVWSTHPHSSSLSSAPFTAPASSNSSSMLRLSMRNIYANSPAFYSASSTSATNLGEASNVTNAYHQPPYHNFFYNHHLQMQQNNNP